MLSVTIPDGEGEIVLECKWEHLIKFEKEAKDSALINFVLRVSPFI